MPKIDHEIRDALYGLVSLDSQERALLDTGPVQRLRCIHQLGMSHYVYPGATHTRLEHSIGVMDIATRAFDVVFNRNHSNEIRDRLGQNLTPEALAYWRRVIRAAALLHDVGHLPFSHAAEKELLPSGWNHERLTVAMVRESEVADRLRKFVPRVDVEDVVDVAWDIRKRAPVEEPSWTLDPMKLVLNELLCGNTFGADRMDYLLRDSLHIGVAYGRFDLDRLLNGLRLILDPETHAPVVGLDRGALHAAEALLLARYFMYTQVYFHDVRRAYDMHLKEFILAWRSGEPYSSDWRKVLATTDHEVMSALHEAASDSKAPCHEEAARIAGRRHFRTVYELSTTHLKQCPTVVKDVFEAVADTIGRNHVRLDEYSPTREPNEFWLTNDEGEVLPARTESGVIAQLPIAVIGLVLADPDCAGPARAAAMAKRQSLGLAP
jgi:HD superfamily phosphohydrolase